MLTTEQYLHAIAALGGNLPDDRLTDRTGPNDAAARGLMYTEARRLAREALAAIEKPVAWGPSPLQIALQGRMEASYARYDNVSTVGPYQSWAAWWTRHLDNLQLWPVLAATTGG